jgi:hypothetical protein
VDSHVKTSVHVLEILQYKPVRSIVKHFPLIAFSNVYNSIDIKKCVPKEFSTDKEQLIKGGIQHYKERFAATGKNFSLAT